MAEAKAGDTVKVHYTGKLDDGTVFDRSDGREPLEFTLGRGQIIPGFERAVTGMTPGDKKTEKIAVNDAYGPRREEMVFDVERAQFPQKIQPKAGQRLQVSQPGGMAFVVTVMDVTDAKVKLDANHPLAGKDLTFEITLVAIA